MRGVIQQWDDIHAFSFVLGRGPIVDDSARVIIGHYLMVKVSRCLHSMAQSLIDRQGRIKVSQDAMLFAFDHNGYLTAYHHHDGDNWRSSGIGNRGRQSVAVGEWQSRTLPLIQCLVNKQRDVIFRFPVNQGAVSVTIKDARSKCNVM